MIKSTCDRCGEFRASPTSVVSWVDESDEPLWAILPCPLCGNIVVRPGNPALRSILEALGAPTRMLADPVEHLDDSVVDAKPIDLADIEAFRAVLDRDDELIREFER